MFRSSIPCDNFRYRLWRRASLLIVVSLLFSLLPARLQAQGFERELNASGKSLLTIKNPNGRVSVIASESEKSKVILQATSAGAPVERKDVNVSGNEITVRERRQADRID